MQIMSRILFFEDIQTSGFRCYIILQ